MIPGLQGFLVEKLAIARDLSHATLGISAELLSGLSCDEIAARLGAGGGSKVVSASPPKGAPTSFPSSTASSSAASAPAEAGGTGAEASAAAASSSGNSSASNSASNSSGEAAAASTPKIIVVFDGPGRTTKSRLDNGLQRRKIMRALVDAGIPFLVAPSLAAAQLAFLYLNNYITHVVGAEEALLWADVPLVVDLFSAINDPQRAAVIHRHDILHYLRITESTFIESVLGAGRNAVIEPSMPLLTGFSSEEENVLGEVTRLAFQFGGQPPPVVVPPPPSTGPAGPAGPTSQSTQGAAGGAGVGNSSSTPDGTPEGTPENTPGSTSASSAGAPISVLRASALTPQTPPEYVQQLRQALVFVQRQPVLNVDGTVHLFNLSGQPVPRDLVDVIGRQLAPEMFWYLNKGVIGPELLQGMIYGEFSDCFSNLGKSATSDSTSAAQLQKVERAMQPVRQQAYSLLTATAHRYFQVKSVKFEFGDFVRTSPVLPNAPSADATPAQVVAAAVAHVRVVTKSETEWAVSDIPEELSRRVVGSSGTPASLLVSVVQLALRQLLESVVEWFMATNKVPRELSSSVFRSMPW